ncbi:hypothetical protein AB1N83_011267 [Pleurotus pulmonarius]
MLERALCSDFADKLVALPCGHFHPTGVQFTVDAHRHRFTCPTCDASFDRSSNYGVVRPLLLPHVVSPNGDDRHGVSRADTHKRIPSPSAFEGRIAALEKEEKLLTAELDLLEKERLFLDTLAKIKHSCRPDGTPILRFFARRTRKRQKERVQANVSMLIRSFIWYTPNAVLLMTIYAADVNVSLTISSIIWATLWTLIIILGRVFNE